MQTVSGSNVPFRSAGEEQRALTGWPWPHWPWDTGGAPTYMRMGVDQTLRLYSVFGAARLLADSIASMPPILYVQGSNGPTQSPVTPSLFVQPSVHGTLFDWLHRCVFSMALHGDAFGHITARNWLGYPTMVEWLLPQEVDVLDRAPSGPGSYMQPLWYWRGRQMNPEDVVHIPWFCTPYHVRGFSPIGALQASANIGHGAQQFASAWFHNGGVPPGVFRNTQQKVSKEDADTITERITNRLQQRKPLVHGNDWEYTAIQIRPDEARFVECAVGSTLFSMADGTRRRADQLAAGDEVVSWDGSRLVPGVVSGAVEMPVAPTVRVRTAGGHELTTSLNHPYLASRRPRSAGKRYYGTLDSNAGWMQARQLRPGDYVRLGLDWDGHSDYLNPETGWALGALTGDGCMSNAKRSIKFTSIEPGILDRLASWLEVYGAKLVRIGETADYQLSIGGVGKRGGGLLRQELRTFGMLGHSAPDKRVPDVVARGGPKSWAAFLSGYLDTDGTVSKQHPKIVWSSVSLDLLRDCQHLLSMLGVKSSVRPHTSAGRYQVKGIECNRRDSWCLDVCGIGNVRRLAEILDLAHPVKARRLADWDQSDRISGGAQSDPRWVRVEAVEDAGAQVTYGITVEGTHTHVTNGLITHNTAQLTATQIAVIYGIPPEMIGGQAGGSLTYNTVSSNALNFLTFSLRPWLFRIESALSNLFPRGQFVRFDTSELLRTDPLTKAQIDQMNLGYYPPAHWAINEVRKSNFMPPIDADQLPAMYRPGGGAVPGEPEDPAPTAPSGPAPDTLGGIADHPTPSGAK